MTAKRRNRVIRGNAHLTVYPYTHPGTGAKRWRFAFQEDGKWKYRTFKTKIEAETAAGNILDEIPAGLAWSALDADARKFLEEVHRRTAATDRPAVLAFLRSRDSSAEIAAAVAAFLAHKQTEAGEITPHLRTVENLLDQLATHFSGRRVSEIHAPELAAWWTARGEKLSNKSRRDIRAHLVTFWRWSLKQGLAGTDPVTAADRLPAPRVEFGQKRVLTTDELCAVLDAAEPQFRAWCILGAFAGLRPEEIAPKQAAKGKKARKRGILCEEIDWQFGVIRLPAEVSKGGTRPRNIPMNDALKAGLQWAGIRPGMTGPVCLTNPTEVQELKRLGKLIFKTGWPKDALRHSFGSYRNAILRNMPQVAEEMGTSVAMLHNHYHNPRATAEGTAWFALRPHARSDGDPMKWTTESGHPESSEPQPIENTA